MDVRDFDNKTKELIESGKLDEAFQTIGTLLLNNYLADKMKNSEEEITNYEDLKYNAIKFVKIYIMENKDTSIAFESFIE